MTQTKAQQLRSVLWLTIMAGLVAMLVALWLGETLPLVAGGLGFGYVATRLLRQPNSGQDEPPPVATLWTGDEPDMPHLIDSMLHHERYALLLRPQLAHHMTPDQIESAHHALQDGMAFLPAGEVELGRPDTTLDDDEQDQPESGPPRGKLVEVPAIFLDRYPVTNRQYQHFVSSGGYEQMAIWDPQIWPAVGEFLDATGRPGPRYWQNGRCLAGEEDFPVVGVNWYESAAYARWVGKRLPSDPEWVKAASWPVSLADDVRLQRRYPWGEAFDPRQANLWGSGERLTDVRSQPAGVNPAGIEQLSGNAWEWMSGDYTAETADHWEIILPCVMKSLRGGAFDTYFENEATAQFASGENPVARKHNIGFRCAVSAIDFLPQEEEAEQLATSN